jgi:hypothetical protein
MDEVAVILRQVLERIDAGDLDASELQRDYLAGSAAALERVSVPSF